MTQFINHDKPHKYQLGVFQCAHVLLVLKRWDGALKLENLSKVDKLKAYFGNKGNQWLYFIWTMSSGT